MLQQRGSRRIAAEFPIPYWTASHLTYLNVSPLRVHELHHHLPKLLGVAELSRRRQQRLRRVADDAARRARLPGFDRRPTEAGHLLGGLQQVLYLEGVRPRADLHPGVCDRRGGDFRFGGVPVLAWGSGR